MAPVVTADHLSKWYGQVIGLNDVSVNVPSGITGLLGPNGAGKSTFMKLITGQLKPSKGSINVLGEPIWANPALYFRIGFCPEQDAFYERMTGLEWVTALVRLNGVTETEATAMANRALEAVELTDAANKKIGAYSKGMRQRVKMAQALAHDPELLILDEPLAGMDPIARRKTIRMIKEWGRAGRSIIVSSHILHEIESMTADILLINQGRILAEGNVHQIRDLIDTHPHTVYVRADDPRGLAREFLARADVISLRFEPGAVLALARKFQGASVGAACGRLVFERGEHARDTPESDFWDRETRLKEAEGRLGICLGANGAIYAVRRELVTKLPEDTTSLDDFLIPVRVARAGKAIVFASEAVAREDAARDVAAEVSRRFRIGVGAGQVLDAPKVDLGGLGHGDVHRPQPTRSTQRRVPRSCRCSAARPLRSLRSRRGRRRLMSP
jgi:ABC-2 type transport system ATP-binding protein